MAQPHRRTPLPRHACPAPPLLQLNELHNGLLMACAADGSVRVWRNYAVRGQQRLATAWQVRGAGRGGDEPAEAGREGRSGGPRPRQRHRCLPGPAFLGGATLRLALSPTPAGCPAPFPSPQSVLVAAAGSPTRPAVYHWSPGYSALFAAGGRSAGATRCRQNWPRLGRGQAGDEGSPAFACLCLSLAPPNPPSAMLVRAPHCLPVATACPCAAVPPPSRLPPAPRRACCLLPAERIYMWDLERENCIAQLNLPGGGGNGDAAAAPAVEHIAASCCSPLLYAADGTGTGAACWAAPFCLPAPTCWLPASARCPQQPRAHCLPQPVLTACCAVPACAPQCASLTCAPASWWAACSTSAAGWRAWWRSRGAPRTTWCWATRGRSWPSWTAAWSGGRRPGGQGGRRGQLLEGWHLG